MKRRYKVVDAFSARPLLGNPVAVVLDAEGLDGDQMQAIARWTNLSETTFVLPPTDGADYRLRIFTPGSELPFAGHPTLGSAHAVIEAGQVTPKAGKLVQACGVGLVEITVQGEGAERELALTLPPAQITPLDDADIDEMEAVLGRRVLRAPAPAVMNVGAIWAVAQLADIDTLTALTPDFGRSAALERRLGITGLSLFAVDASGRDIETRSFAPSCGVNEDPVCGSGNGSIAVFRRQVGQLAQAGWSYSAQQGRCVGRDGVVRLSADAAGVLRVGGQCVTTANGTLEL
ncbi:MAG: phenazine biosynthesis protein PhzF [Phenylobacterium sp.]|uniref:PhzF family phenazine biosynthesis protein n=1 Tax=Phenylobacterium sp. TaxID=1871053 RepID=UPI0025CCB573|nr:PhzF family phenazine biosynthesis protein [Phenylobacterium sp.]MBA4012706.1 phenazine biosynthesis protein PhzF [Phenylobacterium sp.]